MFAFANALASPSDPTVFMTDPAHAAELEALVKSRQISLYLPFLIGAWLDSLAFGLIFILFCRWVIYIRPTDSKWTQALVWWLMIPTCVTSAFLLAHCFYLFVGGFGEYLRIFNVDLPRATTVNFVLSRVPAASFFAVRAWRLNGKPLWLPIVVIPCLLGCLVGGIMHTALADKIPLSQLSLNFIVMYSVCEVVSDIVITGSLFYGLLKRKSGWQHTDRLIKRLATLLMETQTPPALTALLFLAMSLVVGDGTILGYFIFYTKIHVLCLLGVVNARTSLAESAGGASTYHSSGNVKTGIRVHTETITNRNSFVPPTAPSALNDVDEEPHESTADLVRKRADAEV